MIASVTKVISEAKMAEEDITESGILEKQSDDVQENEENRDKNI
jgi:DNA gyrase subunit A